MTTIINEQLANWIPSDIKEWYDPYTTIQMHRNVVTREERLFNISQCEICRTPLWLTIKTLDNQIISEKRLTVECDCDPDFY